MAKTLSIPKPATQYWEDHYCSVCEKITEFRRNEKWEMICEECKSPKSKYNDPLWDLINPDVKFDLLKKRLAPKFKEFNAKIRAIFPNITTIDEDSFYRAKGYHAKLHYRDWDNIEKEWDTACLKDFIKIAEHDHIQIFITVLCDHGMGKAARDWNAYFTQREKQQQAGKAILTKAMECFAIQEIHFKRGLIYIFKGPGIIIDNEIQTKVEFLRSPDEEHKPEEYDEKGNLKREFATEEELLYHIQWIQEQINKLDITPTLEFRSIQNNLWVDQYKEIIAADKAELEKRKQKQSEG
jgi:hypothetical protein